MGGRRASAGAGARAGTGARALPATGRESAAPPVTAVRSASCNPRLLPTAPDTAFTTARPSRSDDLHRSRKPDASRIGDRHRFREPHPATSAARHRFVKRACNENRCRSPPFEGRPHPKPVTITTSDNSGSSEPVTDTGFTYPPLTQSGAGHRPRVGAAYRKWSPTPPLPGRPLPKAVPVSARRGSVKRNATTAAAFRETR